MASMLVMARAAPVAEPEPFLGTLGALAIPALTGSAIIDAAILGKIAFIKGMFFLQKLFLRKVVLNGQVFF